MNEGPWPWRDRVSPSEQNAFILKQGEDGTTVAEICRTAGISQATCFRWREGISEQFGGLFTRRTRYGRLLPDQMRRLKAFGDENSRLKKIVVDLTLDREML